MLDEVPQLAGRAVDKDCPIEELVHAVHMVGDHRRPAGEHVEEPVRHETPGPHHAPMVIEHDAGRRVHDWQQRVVDVVGHDQLPVHETTPPPAVYAGTQPGGESVAHNRPEDVAGLGHDRDVVAMSEVDRLGTEATVVGRLQHDLHRGVRPLLQVSGEPRRRHQHQIGGVELLVADRLGMADDPQHVPLAGRTADRLQAAQHQMHIARPAGEVISLIGRLDPYLLSLPPQAPGEGPRQVPVTPALGHLGRRRRHGDGQAQRRAGAGVGGPAQQWAAPPNGASPARPNRVDGKPELPAGPDRPVIDHHRARDHHHSSPLRPQPDAQFHDGRVEVLRRHQSTGRLVGRPVHQQCSTRAGVDLDNAGIWRGDRACFPGLGHGLAITVEAQLHTG